MSLDFMQRLSLDELAEQASAFDRAVDSTPGIDHFCSSSEWVLPAARALMPPREPWIYSADECFWAFMRGEHAEGFGYLEPLEAMWALACPTVGPDSATLLAGLETLFADAGSEWKLMALPGMSADNEFLMSVIKSFAERLRIGLGQSTSRLVVDLEGGVEAYLGRRSRNFRRALRRGEKKAKEAGIGVVDASTASATELFARIQAVEKRGWKGRDEVGITEGAMHDFYQRMMPRLCLRGAQRVLFAQHEEQDIAYIFGGLRMGGYRGLQFSYDEDYREYGLGNLLQIEQIRRLCAEGALTYDLGMHMDYKLRWADREYQTLTLLLIR